MPFASGAGRGTTHPLLERFMQFATERVSVISPEVHAADGLGHFLLLEDPAYVAQLVRRFVSQS